MVMRFDTFFVKTIVVLLDFKIVRKCENVKMRKCEIKSCVNLLEKLSISAYQKYGQIVRANVCLLVV